MTNESICEDARSELIRRSLSYYIIDIEVYSNFESIHKPFEISNFIARNVKSQFPN